MDSSLSATLTGSESYIKKGRKGGCKEGRSFSELFIRIYLFVYCSLLKACRRLSNGRENSGKIQNKSLRYTTSKE